jgi:hypothetical protein
MSTEKLPMYLVDIGLQMGSLTEDAAPHNRVIQFLEAELLAKSVQSKGFTRKGGGLGAVPAVNSR